MFKRSGLTLPSGGSQEICCRISLREMTTRKHYPGVHEIDARLNARDVRVGRFVYVSD